MKKSIAIDPAPRKKPVSSQDALDAFVTGQEEASPPSEKPLSEKQKMKRLTFDIDAALHKRIRLTCVHREKDMAEEIRRILAENFPA
jgi:hypothetical protein